MEFNTTTIKALVGEFLVTYLFIFTICLNGILNGSAGVVASGVSTGMAAVALIYSFGGISGAHFNPAVTVGALVGQKIDIIQGVLYIVLQNVAAVAAVGTLMFLNPAGVDALVLKPAEQAAQAVVREILSTFVLVFVIYATAMGVNTDSKSLDGDAKAADKAEAKMNFAPIAIGLALGFLCFLGGCFNPARAMAPALMKLSLGDVWIYWVGDLIGAILAAALHTYFFAA